MQDSPTLPSAVTAAATRPLLRRYTSLDTLRGGLLLMMALNHIPSAFHWVTQQPLGFMTAAEGFVFLAGLVVGLVYFRRWENRGAKETTRKLLWRGVVIYRAHLCCIAAIYVWMFLHMAWRQRMPVGSPWIWFQQPWESLLATLALLHQPGLLDVLPTYCGLLLISPLAMWQLSKGKAVPVLIASGVIWGLTNLIDPPRPTVFGVINTGAFNFGAWQFLYIIGLVLGVREAQGTRPPFPVKPVWVGGVAAAVILLSACSHGWLSLGISPATWSAMTNKNNLAPLRLLNVGLVILLFHVSMNAARKPIDLPLFSLLGRHSLLVFSVHCVIALVMLGLPEIFGMVLLRTRSWTAFDDRGPFYYRNARRLPGHAARLHFFGSDVNGVRQELN